MNHSPGPWNVDKHTSGEIYDKHSRLVAVVASHIADQQLPYRANARLIAAAPALLQACLVAWKSSKARDAEETDTLEFAIFCALGVYPDDRLFEQAKEE